MDLLTEITRFNPDSALREWVADTIQPLLEQGQKETIKAARLNMELHAANLKIQALTMELAHHRRMRFSARSEALSAEQRELFEETWNTDASALEAQAEALSEKLAADAGNSPRRPRAGRQALPDHLPRIEHRHEPDTCTCGQCGRDLVKIGEDISEQLDVEPARFFVHRHIRPQYACRGCETVIAAAIPPAIIDGGMAATGLLAWLATSKFLDHLPLYRLEQIGARQGVPLARSTLADWIGRIGVALQPLADRLAELLRQRSVLHADETPVQQLDPGMGKTKRAYLWAYRSNDLEPGPPIVVFDYQTSRSGSHAAAFLRSWRGALMVDDFSGYKALFKIGMTELACLAHCRRKFFDLHAANQSPIAAAALVRIGELYAIEKAGKKLDAVARQQLRHEQAKPKMVDFHAWLVHTRKTVADGSSTANAMDYTIKRWHALIRYVDSGSLPIDNNPVENTIRPIAIGKKNWLYAGSERAGRRAAAIQSLLGTAKLNGQEPHAWLKDVLEKLPTWPNDRIDELLPLRAESY